MGPKPCDRFTAAQRDCTASEQVVAFMQAAGCSSTLCHYAYACSSPPASTLDTCAVSLIRPLTSSMHEYVLCRLIAVIAVSDVVLDRRRRALSPGELQALSAASKIVAHFPWVLCELQPHAPALRTSAAHHALLRTSHLLCSSAHPPTRL